MDSIPWHLAGCMPHDTSSGDEDWGRQTTAIDSEGSTELQSFGDISKFWESDTYMEGGDEDFNSYIEQFEHYWKDSSVKKSAFITALGKHPYKTLKDWLLPATLEDKLFEDLVQVLKEHYVPGNQVIAERFKSNCRYQLETESVATFAVELRHLAAKCTFRNTLDDALRDRFVRVSGIRQFKQRCLRRES